MSPASRHIRFQLDLLGNGITGYCHYVIRMAEVANRWEEHPKKEMSVSVRDREHGRSFLWPYDKGLKGHDLSAYGLGRTLGRLRGRGYGRRQYVFRRLR